ncbi:hypothetical protein BaRGS_00015472 [Batillaria attramentaria]|uniref:Uncharacterized protein n=1 Tax=Batillaria attramentaria TaxID=370345 RepID=A0ABD0L1H6_9CAEN
MVIRRRLGYIELRIVPLCMTVSYVLPCARLPEHSTESGNNSQDLADARDIAREAQLSTQVHKALSIKEERAVASRFAGSICNQDRVPSLLRLPLTLLPPV